MRVVRYSTRTLLLGMAAVCVFFSVVVVPAEKQRTTVKWIRDAGGEVGYHNGFNDNGMGRFGDHPKMPEWVLRYICHDYLAPIVYVQMHGQHVTDKDVSRVASLHKLRTLGLSSTGISDEGLSHIIHLPNLKYLSLGLTDITDNGAKQLAQMFALERLTLPNHISGETVANLQNKLPNCSILID